MIFVTKAEGNGIPRELQSNLLCLIGKNFDVIHEESQKKGEAALEIKQCRRWYHAELLLQ